MSYFFIALNFLTRISIFRSDDWGQGIFSKSVKFFPLVGGILGFCYAFFAYIVLYNNIFEIPIHIFAGTLIFLIFYLSGPLFFDGFMDTMDGIFSGRDREKILEIMKDSRVGANAVIAFTIYMVFLYSVFLDIDKDVIIFSLFSAPVISHFLVVTSIRFFPYARKDGIGKMFKINDNTTIVVASFLTFLLLNFSGILGFISLFINLIFMFIFNSYLIKVLGGLTGDTYGALAIISFLLTQVSFLFLYRII